MKLFETQMELYFFAALSFLATFIFAILSITYKYRGEVLEEVLTDTGSSEGRE
jgi:hypothetical protein